MELTPQQEKSRKNKIARYVKEGDVAMLEHLFEVEDTIDEKFTELDQKINELKSTVIPKIEDFFSQIKGKDSSPEEVAKALLNNQSFLNSVTPKDGEDGKDYVLTDTDKKDISQQIKVPIVEKVIEKTEIIHEQPIVTEVNKIVKEIDNTEQTKKILETAVVDIEEIKANIEDIEKDIEDLKKRRQTLYSGGGGGGGGKIVKAYDLSSQLNGVLKTFNLPALWRIISVHSSSFPYNFRETVDYTWTPQSITFTSEINAGGTLATGQTLTVIYAEA